jgi:hypothetical protein
MTESDTTDRRKRHAEAIALIDKVLADVSGCEEQAWKRLKVAIEESRPSYRKRFSDDDE